MLMYTAEAHMSLKRKMLQKKARGGIFGHDCKRHDDVSVSKTKFSPAGVGTAGFSVCIRVLNFHVGPVENHAYLSLSPPSSYQT